MANVSFRQKAKKDKFQYLADAISEHHQGIVLSLLHTNQALLSAAPAVSLTNLNQLSQQISYSFIHNILSIKIPAILKHSREFVNVILLINPKPLDI